MSRTDTEKFEVVKILNINMLDGVMDVGCLVAKPRKRMCWSVAPRASSILVAGSSLPKSSVDCYSYDDHDI